MITNVEAAHIGHLGSLDAIADEKGRDVFGGILQGGTAVLPADSPCIIARLLDRVPEGVALRDFGAQNL